MSEEKEYFYRHSTNIVDHTKGCFGDLLDHYLTAQGLTLHQFIQRYQHEIYHLCYDVYPCCMCPPSISKKSRRNKVLYQSQLEILLDTNGGKLPGHNPLSRSSPHCCCPVKANLTLEDIDITLIKVLIVSFTNIAPPGSAVRNALDDLVNIRNKSYAHAVKGRMSQCEYNSLRKEVKKHLLIVATACGKETEITQKLIDTSKQPLNDGIFRQYQSSLLTQAERGEASEKHFKRAADKIEKALGTKIKRTKRNISSLSDIRCVEGRDAYFKCDLSEENMESTWLKNGIEIFNSEKYVMTTKNKSHYLEIASVEPCDSGSYSISVNGLIESASLTVEAYFSKRLRNQSCIEGEPVKFVCEVIEDNVPAIWFKDGLEVEESNFISISCSGKLHRLSIHNAKKSDEGEYSIIVQNRTRKATLQVEAFFLKTLEDVKCKRGDDVTFSCETIEGGSIGKWFRNKFEIHESEKHVLTNSGKCFHLKVLNVTAADEGVYSLQIDGKKTVAMLHVTDKCNQTICVFKEPTYNPRNNKKESFFEKTDDRYKFENVESPQNWYSPASNKSIMTDSGISDILSPDSYNPSSVVSVASVSSPYNEYDTNQYDHLSVTPVKRAHSQQNYVVDENKTDSIAGREDELNDVYNVISKEMLVEELSNAYIICDNSNKYASYPSFHNTTLGQNSTEYNQNSRKELVDLKPLTRTENFDERQESVNVYQTLQNKQVVNDNIQDNIYFSRRRGMVDHPNKLQQENSNLSAQVMNLQYRLRTATYKIQQLVKENGELKDIIRNQERKFEMVQSSLYLQWPWNR